MHGCPRDRSSLIAHQAADATSWLCHKCDGIWLPTKVVASAIGHVPRGGTPTNRGPTQQTALHCPDDYSLLVAVHYHGVEIDLCPKCSGVWLDKGEIEQIVRKRRGYTVGDATLDIVTQPDAAVALGDGAIDVAGAILEFLANALSGL